MARINLSIPIYDLKALVMPGLLLFLSSWLQKCHHLETAVCYHLIVNIKVKICGFTLPEAVLYAISFRERMPLQSLIGIFKNLVPIKSSPHKSGWSPFTICAYIGGAIT
jgi:hypothetical protein